MKDPVMYKKALTLSQLVWQYFVDHPEVKHKSQLPEKMANGLRYMTFECPMCEYNHRTYGDLCVNCPLSIEDSCCKGHYKLWVNAKDDDSRHLSARVILALINRALDKVK